MDGSFGEIIHPTSRAFWSGDDDDNAQETEEVSFAVEWTNPCPDKIETFVIAETPLITDFMKEYVVKGHNSICVIKSENLKEPSTIYHLPNNLFLCLVDSQVNWKLAGDFIEAISGILSKSSNIISIACNHVSQLRSPSNTTELSFMKSLSTRRAPEKQKSFAPRLEEPNIVAGVAAGATAYAEIMELPATLYILYLDGFELDSSTASPLSALLKNLLHLSPSPFHHSPNLSFNKGNLYM